MTATTRASATGGTFQPLLLLDVELTQPLPAIASTASTPSSTAHVLLRLATEPLGILELGVGVEGVTPLQLAAAALDGFGDAIEARLPSRSRPTAARLASSGLGVDADDTDWVRTRHDILADAPPFSVVLCTRDRADRIPAALDYLSRQQYPSFEVVVVDNAPRNDAVRSIVPPRGLTYRYVLEPRPGLSWARNAGAAAAAGRLVAFLDDDEVPDPWWLAELLRGFRATADVGCVSGMILPAAVGTEAQGWFEQKGGHSKGRGFEPALFRRDGPQSPLYPLPAFGAGGNMAFRSEVLAAIGGFDVALGSGTPSRAGEDTYAFTRVLLAGYPMTYQPSALVRHHHYADLKGLHQQLYGYGVGLTAYYAALLRRDPGVLPELLRLMPAAVKELRGTGTVVDPPTAVPSAVPVELRRARLQGMVRGPFSYVRSVVRQSRIRDGARDG